MLRVRVVEAFLFSKTLLYCNMFCLCEHLNIIELFLKDRSLIVSYIFKTNFTIPRPMK